MSLLLLPKTMFDTLDSESLGSVLDFVTLGDLRTLLCAAGFKFLERIQPRVIHAVGYHALLRRMLRHYARLFAHVRYMHTSVGNSPSLQETNFCWSDRSIKPDLLPKNLIVLDAPDTVLLQKAAVSNAPNIAPNSHLLLPQLKVLRVFSCELPLSAISHVLEVVDIRSNDEHDEILFDTTSATSPLCYSLTSLSVSECQLRTASDFFSQQHKSDVAAFSQLTELKITSRDYNRDCSSLISNIHLPSSITNLEWRSDRIGWERDELDVILPSLPQSVTRVALGICNDDFKSGTRVASLVSAIQTHLPLIRRVVFDEDEIVVTEDGHATSLLQELRGMASPSTSTVHEIFLQFGKYECVQAPSMKKATDLCQQLPHIMITCPSLGFLILNGSCRSAQDMLQIQQSWRFNYSGSNICQATCLWLARLGPNAFPTEQHLVHCWIVSLPSISAGSYYPDFKHSVAPLLESLSSLLPPRLFRIMLHLVHVVCDHARREEMVCSFEDEVSDHLRLEYGYHCALPPRILSMLSSSLLNSSSRIDIDSVPLAMALFDDEACFTAHGAYAYGVAENEWRAKFGK